MFVKVNSAQPTNYSQEGMYGGYTHNVGRKVSAHLSATKGGKESTPGVYPSQNPFFNGATPHRARVFEYSMEDPYTPGPEYFRDRHAQMASSYNVLPPLYDYSALGNRQYPDEVDEEEEGNEEIPDERECSTDVISINNQFVPRDSVTGNIITHSFIAKAPFNKISFTGLSKNGSESMRHQNLLLSSHESLRSSQNGGWNMEHELFSATNNMNIIDQRIQDRAVDNWARMFKRCMLEYRRHRLRKAAKGLMSPSPNSRGKVIKNQRAGYYQHQTKRVINPKSMYGFYPCVRFIQRCVKIKQKLGTLRYATAPS